MKQKLMVLAAGALSALAFASLPSAASAGEFAADCSSGPGTICNATFAGGAAELEDDSGLRITCTNVTGTVALTGGATTGSASLTAHGCKEPIFATSCTSAGEPAGTLHTGSGLVAHLVFIDATPTTLVGVLATNLNMTFTCPSVGIQKTVTGSVIAKIENPECAKFRSAFSGVFEKGATTGSQQYTQVTTIGTVFNLTSGPHASDATKSTIVGTGTITVTEGKTIMLTC